MKVLKSEMVRRFHVELDVEETRTLRQLSMLPPEGSEPVRLWMTAEEIEHARRAIAHAQVVRS